jgi:hypothetical protein
MHDTPRQRQTGVEAVHDGSFGVIAAVSESIATKSALRSLAESGVPAAAGLAATEQRAKTRATTALRSESRIPAA